MKTVNRWLLYLAGMLVLALGLTLNTKAGLGVSPIISIAFAVSEIWGWNFGDMTFLLYSLFVAGQFVLRGKNSRLTDLLQLPLSLAFSRVLNLYSALIPYEAAEHGFLANFGLLLAAILSDTLVFRSPTCTPIDVNAANRLAKIAGVDINEFANEMFEAGEKLDGKTAEEVFLQDFKVFMCGDIRFGVAQGSYMTRKNLTAAEALLKPYLEEARNKQNVEDIYMLLTDVPKEESVVICDGRYAAGVLTDGFEIQPGADGSWTLPGVVSRKKQFIPALMTAYQEL